eukprot:TRINITY_DN36777_c0_g1_i1.p1 TRINITY_DN36777_c0_g1~~TRINITY_DN36777_c0_g1_i1.p1  ORF type:complete len:337 (+),score=79.13 TRINITY_DN36777_c0_g1_i1:60-1070(+)
MRSVARIPAGGGSRDRSSRLRQLESENKQLLKELSTIIFCEIDQQEHVVKADLNLKSLILSPPKGSTTTADRGLAYQTHEHQQQPPSLTPVTNIIEELEQTSRKLLADTSLQSLKSLISSYEQSKRRSVMLRIKMKPGCHKSTLRLYHGEWWVDETVTGGDHILGVECYQSSEPQAIAETFRKKHFRVVASATVKVWKKAKPIEAAADASMEKVPQPNESAQLLARIVEESIPSWSPVCDPVWDIPKKTDSDDKTICDWCRRSLLPFQQHDQQQQTTPVSCPTPSPIPTLAAVPISSPTMHSPLRMSSPLSSVPFSPLGGVLSTVKPTSGADLDDL